MNSNWTNFVDCINGGLFYLDADTWEPKCVCPPGFEGSLCEQTSAEMSFICENLGLCRPFGPYIFGGAITTVLCTVVLLTSGLFQYLSGLCQPPRQSSKKLSDNRLELSTSSCPRYTVGRSSRSTTVVGQATMTAVTCQQAIRRRRRYLLRQWMALNHLSRTDLNDLFRSISLEALRSNQSTKQCELNTSTDSDNHLSKWKLDRIYPKSLGCAFPVQESLESSDHLRKKKNHVTAIKRKNLSTKHPCLLHSQPHQYSPPSTSWFSHSNDSNPNSLTQSLNSCAAQDLWCETEMYLKMFPSDYEQPRRRPNQAAHSRYRDQCPVGNADWCCRTGNHFNPQSIHPVQAIPLAGPSTACAHSFYHSYEGEPSTESCAIVSNRVCEYCEEAKQWTIYPQLTKASGCTCCVCLHRHRGPWPKPKSTERHQTRLSLPREESDSESTNSPEVYENLYAI